MNALEQARLTVAERVIAVQARTLAQYAMREQIRERRLRILTLAHENPAIVAEAVVVGAFIVYLLACYVHDHFFEKESPKCEKSQPS